MKTAEKNFLLCLISLFWVGCSGHLPPDRTDWPINAEEMYYWQPPDETVLIQRRANQTHLDGLTEEISILFANHASLTGQERAMLESLGDVEQKLNKMDSSYSQDIEIEQKRIKQMEQDIESSNTGFLSAQDRLKAIMEIKPPINFSVSDYNLALNHFRNGKFKDSLKLFFKLDKQNPPAFLKDNIQFGIGSAFYRLKNYTKAISHFHKVLDNYAQGDKRFISYFMLGIIHNSQGEKSRAIYILEQALNNNPPDKLRAMINRLINTIND
ncbi:MAG: tetratricopeptide repeat protein [Nitrospinaceae bacterium]|nr:tetratricopeptide repeat protein [Nitrospinaceae bacterium]